MMLAAKQVGEDGLTLNPEIRANRAKFALFMKQYSNRRGKNFHEVFPEYTEFYELCMREYRKMFDAPEDETNFKTGIDKSKKQLERKKKDD